MHTGALSESFPMYKMQPCVFAQEISYFMFLLTFIQVLWFMGPGLSRMVSRTKCFKINENDWKICFTHQAEKLVISLDIHWPFYKWTHTHTHKWLICTLVADTRCPCIATCITIHQNSCTSAASIVRH